MIMFIHFHLLLTPSPSLPASESVPLTAIYSPALEEYASDTENYAFRQSVVFPTSSNGVVVGLQHLLYEHLK